MDERIKGILLEIKNRSYPYFSFNYDEVFKLPEYEAVAYKLINFHIWHKLFIDDEELSKKDSGKVNNLRNLD